MNTEKTNELQEKAELAPISELVVTELAEPKLAENQFKLKSGDIATVREGKARDAVKAQKLCNGSGETYLCFAIAVLTTFTKPNGSEYKLVGEQVLDELSFSDYTSLSMLVQKINFPDAEISA